MGVIVFFVGLAILFGLNQPGGPVTETTGIVENIGSVPYDTKPPSRTVTVRLPGGASVQADVSPNVIVMRGEKARLRVYRRVITGTEAYELIGIENR